MPEFVLSLEAECDLDEIHARICVDKASTFTPRLPNAPTGVAIAAPTTDESIGGKAIPAVPSHPGPPTRRRTLCRVSQAYETCHYPIM